MNLGQSLLEIVSLVMSLALVGLILSRSTETATVIQASTGGLAALIDAAGMNSAGGISARRRY